MPTGTMPRTRFIEKKPWAKILFRSLLSNKIDKPSARQEEVVDEVLELSIGGRVRMMTNQVQLFYVNKRSTDLHSDSPADRNLYNASRSLIPSLITSQLQLVAQDEPLQFGNTALATLNWTYHYRTCLRVFIKLGPAKHHIWMEH